MLKGCPNTKCAYVPIACPIFWKYCPHCGSKLIDVSGKILEVKEDGKIHTS